MSTHALIMSRIFTVILCLGLHLSWAQQQRSPHWHLKNDRGNRYEGSYTKDVSSYSVNLVSLVAGTIPNYQFRQNQQLKVRFYCPSTQPYQLRAEELKTTRYYWMQDKNTQAATGWYTFAPWPVDAILDDLQVPHENLGVAVELGRVGSGWFVPAWVYQSSAPGSARSYTAQIQLGFSVARGEYKIYPGKGVTANALRAGKISAKSGGDTFPIVIPINSLASSGWYTVEVNLRDKRRLDLTSYSFSFYHKKG